MSPDGFNDSDLHALADRGIEPTEAQRQLELLRRPRRYVRLLRPCTPGDGIERIPPDDLPALERGWARAAGAGRFLKFGDETPLANLFVTALDRLGVPTQGFADSTGEMSELYT